MSLNCVLKNCCPDHIKVSYFENQLEQMPPSANYDESVEQYKSFISGMSSFDSERQIGSVSNLVSITEN